MDIKGDQNPDQKAKGNALLSLNLVVNAAGIRTSENLSELCLGKSEWPLVDRGGLKVLCSPLLSEFKQLTHAFTTRKGGDSVAPLDSFNLGKHFPEEHHRLDALKNRQTLCETFGLAFEKLSVPGQVHSTNIAWITEPLEPSETDAILSVTPNLPILLQYADCVPVIIYDRKTHAVAVIHAGWRGTASGITSKAASTLAKVLNSKTSNLVAAIGPAIGPCCYPVSTEVAKKLQDSVRSDASLLIKERQGQPHPDLKALNALQLLEAEVAAVDVSNQCTSCNADLFYSHRKSGGKTGRQGAFAALSHRQLK